MANRIPLHVSSTAHILKWAKPAVRAASRTMLPLMSGFFVLVVLGQMIQIPAFSAFLRHFWERGFERHFFGGASTSSKTGPILT